MGAELFAAHLSTALLGAMLEPPAGRPNLDIVLMPQIGQ